MSAFICEICHAIENTATGDYWCSDVKKCSECSTGKWHGRFEKRICTKKIFDENEQNWDCPNPNMYDKLDNG